MATMAKAVLQSKNISSYGQIGLTVKNSRSDGKKTSDLMDR